MTRSCTIGGILSSRMSWAIWAIFTSSTQFGSERGWMRVASEILLWLHVLVGHAEDQLHGGHEEAGSR